MNKLEIFQRYMIALINATSMDDGDVGAVRLAMQMAMDDLADEYDTLLFDANRQITAGKQANVELAEGLLRLTVQQDRLTAWVNGRGVTVVEDNLYGAVIAAASVAAAVADLSVVRINSNGQINTHFTGTDDELKAAVIAGLQHAHDKLGRTPSRREWDDMKLELGMPTADGIEKRLKIKWSEIVSAAGFAPNQFHGKRHTHETEATTENAEATFRQS